MTKPEYIILHHSLTNDSRTVSWHAIRRYHTHKLGWAAIGYHFGIELVGETHVILMGRMMNKIGAHCKENNNSWGICFVGNFDNYEPEDSMLITGTNLIRSLLDISSLDKDRVVPHNFFNPDKSCPGKKFPIQDFLRNL